MNDTQDEIFQAFIVAIVQQTEPLPAAVQSEFNQTDDNYTVTDILRLTKLHPPLLAAYQTNRVWLRNHSSQRNKMPLPNSKFENNNANNTETDNIASEISNLTDLPKILKKILQAKDSVQASRDIILLSSADGFIHE